MNIYIYIYKIRKIKCEKINWGNQSKASHPSYTYVGRYINYQLYLKVVKMINLIDRH